MLTVGSTTVRQELGVEVSSHLDVVDDFDGLLIGGHDGALLDGQIRKTNSLI